jgi:hypothetical protein
LFQWLDQQVYETQFIELEQVKAGMLIQKELMAGKIANSCKRLKNMTSMCINADGSDNQHQS